ncbi:MAG TPA: DUF2845 domain-containing protein [Burkholderiales bacterium]
MRRTLAALLTMAAVLPAHGGSWTTNSFRTPRGDLVQPGDRMAQVLRAAGAPLHQRLLSTGVSIGRFVGLNREQWTYRGHDGYYVVTFAGDRVERIEVVADR